MRNEVLGGFFFLALVGAQRSLSVPGKPTLISQFLLDFGAGSQGDSQVPFNDKVAL